MPMTPAEERTFLTLLFNKDHRKVKRIDKEGFLLVFQKTGEMVNGREKLEHIAMWHSDELPPMVMLREWYGDELEQAWGSLL